ncbi:MAG: exodeoxyribonuclease VII large subunit [Arenicellaceae bacterium]|nr:exodeoxyribonuclease VII large subunit [Arenicellaceae bacterium]
MDQTEHIYQVSEFLAEAKFLLEMSYRSVWLEGEISTLRAPASGHLYFTLKDDTTQIRCAMFRNRAARNTITLEEGQLVQLCAKFTIYEARGDVQLIVEEVKEAGTGQLLKRFEELKKKLAAEGLFSEQNKQKIPRFPTRVGIVTSSTGAALRDILTTLKRRNSGVAVVVYPSLVQGAEAPTTLIQALNDCIQHDQCDVVIVSRGGGSIEDLASFNDENLARLITAYPIPIISAVGHEVDFTISDFVADVRAATPTAAAELVAPERIALLAELAARGIRMQTIISQSLQTKSQAVDLLSRSIVTPGRSLKLRFDSTHLLGKRMHRELLNRLKSRASQMRSARQSFRRLHPEKQLVDQYQRLKQMNHLLHTQVYANIKEQQHKIGLAAEKLRLISPLGVLERGYALARLDAAPKAVVKSTQQVRVGDKLNIRLFDGEVSTKILSTVPGNDRDT